MYERASAGTQGFVSAAPWSSPTFRGGNILSTKEVVRDFQAILGGGRGGTPTFLIVSPVLYCIVEYYGWGLESAGEVAGAEDVG